MIAARTFLIVLPLFGQYLSRSVERSTLPSGYGVLDMVCNKTDNIDQIHIDLRPETGKDDVNGNSALVKRIDPQNPLYLGYIGGRDSNDNPKVGQVDDMNKVPQLVFYDCDESELMKNRDYSKPGLRVKYGHVVDESKRDQCLGPAELARRHSPLVMRACPQADDSEQFFVFWKLIERDVDDVVGITTVRSLHFVGKPVGQAISEDFPGTYTVRYIADNDKVVVDYRKPGQKVGKGSEVTLSFTDSKKAP